MATTAQAKKMAKQFGAWIDFDGKSACAEAPDGYCWIESGGESLRVDWNESTKSTELDDLIDRMASGIDESTDGR